MCCLAFLMTPPFKKFFPQVFGFVTTSRHAEIHTPLGVPALQPASAALGPVCSCAQIAYVPLLSMWGVRWSGWIAGQQKCTGGCLLLDAPNIWFCQ